MGDRQARALPASRGGPYLVVLLGVEGRELGWFSVTSSRKKISYFGTCVT